MKSCFVIHRFDGDIYDRRFRETFAPAIERGGAKPVRADEILGPRPIVDKIEQGIRSASVVFAEVSEDNPNVFLELGFALSLGVPCVIACDKAKRQSLPFDLLDQAFIDRHEMSDHDGDWTSYRLSEKGQKYLLRSYSEVMKEEKARAPQTLAPSTSKIKYDDLDDDIPF